MLRATTLLLAAASAASAAFVPQPRCVDAPRQRRALAPAPTMAAKKDETAVAEEEEVQARQVLVDPMKTSLGMEADLLPHPGPPVQTPAEPQTTTTPLYVCVSRYTKGHMPSEALQQAYLTWLGESEVEIERAQYLGSDLDFSGDDVGDSMTEEEIAAMEAAEAEAEAALAAEEEGGSEGVREEERVEMARPALPFVLGNLHLVRSDSRHSLLNWLTTDPIGLEGGYQDVTALRWDRSEEKELCVPASGASRYAVLCLDRPNGEATRTATRSAHLSWLRESGRIHMAGPLLSPEEGEARIGTLLVVNGDDADDVERWAASDPYCEAGLFADVLVAPLLRYAVLNDPGADPAASPEATVDEAADS